MLSLSLSKFNFVPPLHFDLHHGIKTQLHDLYVRHTMNPFSRLRSPICSIKFDDGVIALARSVNGMLLEGEGGVRSPKPSSSVATRSEVVVDDDDDVDSSPPGGGGRKSKKEDGLSWV